MSQIHAQKANGDPIELRADNNGRLLASVISDSSVASSSATGSITTQNVGAPNGNAVTAGSTVSLALNGLASTAAIQVTGTYTGALSVQVQLDATNWVTLSGATSLTNAASAAQSATIASAAVGVWQLDVAGFMGVRVTALAAVTGTAVVTLQSAAESGVLGIDTPIVLAAGSNTIGTVTANQPTPSAISLTSAASTNATSSKATAGSLFEISADNFTAAAKYLKLYNKASAPTVGTDVPVLTVPIPANSFVSLQFGTNGKRFTTGIAFALTGAQAVSDTTALAAGDVHVHGSYI